MAPYAPPPKPLPPAKPGFGGPGDPAPTPGEEPPPPPGPTGDPHDKEHGYVETPEEERAAARELTSRPGYLPRGFYDLGALSCGDYWGEGWTVEEYDLHISAGFEPKPPDGSGSWKYVGHPDCASLGGGAPNLEIGYERMAKCQKEHGWSPTAPYCDGSSTPQVYPCGGDWLEKAVDSGEVKYNASMAWWDWNEKHYSFEMLDQLRADMGCGSAAGRGPSGTGASGGSGGAGGAGAGAGGPGGSEGAAGAEGARGEAGFIGGSGAGGDECCCWCECCCKDSTSSGDQSKSGDAGVAITGSEHITPTLDIRQCVLPNSAPASFLMSAESMVESAMARVVGAVSRSVENLTGSAIGGPEDCCCCCCREGNRADEVEGGDGGTVALSGGESGNTEAQPETSRGKPSIALDPDGKPSPPEMFHFPKGKDDVPCDETCPPFDEAVEIKDPFYPVPPPEGYPDSDEVNQALADLKMGPFFGLSDQAAQARREGARDRIADWYRSLPAAQGYIEDKMRTMSLDPTMSTHQEGLQLQQYVRDMVDAERDGAEDIDDPTSCDAHLIKTLAILSAVETEDPTTAARKQRGTERLDELLKKSLTKADPTDMRTEEVTDPNDPTGRSKIKIRISPRKRRRLPTSVEVLGRAARRIERAIEDYARLDTDNDGLVQILVCGVQVDLRIDELRRRLRDIIAGLPDAFIRDILATRQPGLPAHDLNNNDFMRNEELLETLLNSLDSVNGRWTDMLGLGSVVDELREFLLSDDRDGYFDRRRQMTINGAERARVIIDSSRVKLEKLLSRFPE